MKQTLDISLHVLELIATPCVGTNRLCGYYFPFGKLCNYLQ